ncbi:helix-turn-helix transcriptional regulator [Aestuariivirga sp. YIM B02566]|jgi:transcriptional regulator with XRE-family HTH domain|uniref:Helix-turn-helix transcriptional regulator n=1 Tax=Taklimakanibacter albus TaxID=2800327 RepID=A0ACC5R7B7_9HYPH|nr:helix-turn-helix transcriptional regulator [Aestuariivirga sp. YIM B02566]MBK1868561.1 helix-turn-helix transcriptional regulator [Aestuariivirga sp. YIM B02566]
MTKRDPNFVDRHVGNRVRMRRLLVGMSQEKLGELLGITFQQVQKYEKGSNRVSASRLYQISRVLGVNVQYFYDELKNDDDDTAGFAESEGADAIAGALQSPDGVQIARIISETTDPDKRKLILNAVKLLADYKGP